MDFSHTSRYFAQHNLLTLYKKNTLMSTGFADRQNFRVISWNKWDVSSRHTFSTIRQKSRPLLL